jgi:Ras GTPase-activating-like protein IQGAP2/3
VIKIQSGQDLANIFREPVTSENEDAWTQFKEKEFLDESESENSVVSKRRHLKLGQSDTPLDLQR